MASLLFPPDLPKSLFHDLQVEPEEARSILRPQRDGRYGFGFALSPYRGCGQPEGSGGKLPGGSEPSQTGAGQRQRASVTAPARLPDSAAGV